MKISFIGCGNMAKAMIGGMLSSGLCDKTDITASAKSATSREDTAKNMGIKMVADNKEAAACSEVVILAVKPQMLDGVMEEIKDSLGSDQLILSVVAGRSVDYIAGFIGQDKHIVRVMPNTPAMVGAGMTTYALGANVTEDEAKCAEQILISFGKAVLLPEHLIDSASAVAGCAPAYVYMFIEAMADAGVAEGLPRKVSYELAAQTLLGSAKMVLETGKHPGELKDAVTSPGGSTIEGVAVLEECGFRGVVIDALRAAANKARNM